MDWKEVGLYNGGNNNGGNNILSSRSPVVRMHGAILHEATVWKNGPLKIIFMYRYANAKVSQVWEGIDSNSILFGKKEIYLT